MEEQKLTTPAILPGFMELLPKDQMLFNRMMDTIRKTYETFGFIPLDTPTIEKAEVLLAKSGGDTEKQIYRFQKGDNDLALRFDLTVPLARYVSQHMGELTFPFRRYHINKVFRGERPQKGRFREFYQADIDIVGFETLDIVHDAEILSVIYQTFVALGFHRFTIRINNRKVLNGFYEALGIEDKTGVLRILDKLEKIGPENVRKELGTMNLSEETIDKVMRFSEIGGTPEEVVAAVRALGANEQTEVGLSELEAVTKAMREYGVPEENFKIDLTIARGLDYYTGTVYETILNDYPSIGSVCSGGRYDELASHYTKKSLPGVGISIGLTRLFYQLREAGVLEGDKSAPTEVLVLPMTEGRGAALALASKLRESGISTEVYLNGGKMKKQFGYADKLGIPYCIVVGETEVETGRYTLKDMASGNQEMLSEEEIIAQVLQRKAQEAAKKVCGEKP